MNKEKTLGHDKSHKEAKDTKHPDPRINIGPPQPPNGVGGGTQPLLSERDRRVPQQLAGGGATPPPNGNGDSNGSRGGDRPPPPRRNGDDNGDGGGNDSPPPSDHGQPRHH